MGFDWATPIKSLPANDLLRETKASCPARLSGVLHDLPAFSMCLHNGAGQVEDNLRQILWSICLAVFGVTISRNYSRDHADDEARAKIGQLLEEFGGRLTPGPDRIRAGCYIRYSTVEQDSFESQLRAIFDYAASNGFSIEADAVFFDLGVSGKKTIRKGVEACREARRRRAFDAFLLFSSSRFARNQAMLLQILHEEFVGNGTRVVLIDKKLDSADTEAWKMVGLYAWFDDLQRTAQASNIQASHRSLLAQGIAYSTMPYGFRGEAISGATTRRGLPARRMVIDKSQQQVVEAIFTLYVELKMPKAEIVRQLNRDSTLPLPRKSTKRQFTRQFVTRVLSNPSCVGVFNYDQTSDLSELTPDEMRTLATSDPNVFAFEHLRLISDELFLRARAMTTSNAIRCRKSKRTAEAQQAPLLLNGLLKCHCGRTLAASGSHGKYYVCVGCKEKPTDQQLLFSQLPRELATELILEAICEDIFANGNVVSECVTAVTEQMVDLSAPNGDRLEQLERQRKELADSLTSIHRVFTGESASLLEEQLATMKHELHRLQAEIEEERSKLEQTGPLPSANEIRKMMDVAASRVQEIFAVDTAEDVYSAREFLRQVTGGSILVEQRGECVKNRGWTRVSFTVDVGSLLNSRLRDSVRASFRFEKQIDILPKPALDPQIAEARQLYDDNLFESEIAEQLGCSRSKVHSLLKQSFESTGDTKPNGYERRKRIESQRGTHLYQQISDKVFQLAEEGLLLIEIAERLNVDRNVITASYAFARHRRGLSPLKGQSRRRLLDRKVR